METYLTDMGRSVNPPTEREIELVQRVIKHQLRDCLGSIDRGPAVDIGCGRGEMIGALKNLGFHPVDGCDLGVEQVRAAVAAGFMVERKGGLDFLNGRSGLAWVSAIDVLEHIERIDLPRLLQAAYESLREHGVFVARFPNPGSPFFGAIQFGDPTHCNILGPGALAVLLSRVGFCRVQVLPARPMPHGLRSALRSSVWRVAEAAMYVARLAETGALGGPLTENCLVIARKPSS